MKTLALRTTLAVLTALAIAACENTLPTGPTASSGAAPSALADGGGGQRLGMGKGKGGGGEPPPPPTRLPTASWPAGTSTSSEWPVARAAR